MKQLIEYVGIATWDTQSQNDMTQMRKEKYGNKPGICNYQ